MKLFFFLAAAFMAFNYAAFSTLNPAFDSTSFSVAKMPRGPSVQLEKEYATITVRVDGEEKRVDVECPNELNLAGVQAGVHMAANFVDVTFVSFTPCPGEIIAPLPIEQQAEIVFNLILGTP